MFDDLNDLTPPPVDRPAITARAKALRRRRSRGWAVTTAALVIVAAGSMMAVRLQHDNSQSLVTSDGEQQIAGQPCLSKSLSADAVWSANSQTYSQPLASPPAEQHVTEVQGFITFANISKVSCSLEGAPALVPIGEDGQVLPVTSNAVNCVPAPCTGRGAVALPDGTLGILLAPQERAGSIFLWTAPYCGQGLGPRPRLRVTVPGGQPVAVDLLDRDPTHPATQPSCDHAVPGHGGIRIYVFQAAPSEANVSLYHCGVNPLLYAGRRWQASPAPFDATNAPSTFTGHGSVRIDDNTLTYRDLGGAVISFKPDDGATPTPCA
jgi:hypothetical protein